MELLKQLAYVPFVVQFRHLDLRLRTHVQRRNSIPLDDLTAGLSSTIRTFSMQTNPSNCSDADTSMTPAPTEFGARLLQQAFDLWINPELSRRRAEDRLPSDFVLDAAQIIMNIGGRSIVRINREVKGVLKGFAARPIAEKEAVTRDDLLGIAGIELTTEDANAGHMTLLLHKGAWFIDFDFRYNAARISDTLAKAREFLEVARGSVERGYVGPFCENLFTATELIAKGTLLMLPDERMLRSKTHGFISAEFNRWSKSLNIDGQHTKLFNRLTNLRPHARYPTERPVSLTEEEMKGMLAVAEDMLSKLVAQAPTRVSIEPS